MSDLTPSDGPNVHALSSDLRLAVENLIFEAQEGEPSDEAQQAVDRAAGSLAHRLDALWIIAQEADKEAADYRQILSALDNRGNLIRDLVEKSLRLSGVERLRSPSGLEFGMVGSGDKLEVEDEGDVPERWKKGSLSVTGTKADTDCLHDHLTQWVKAQQDIVASLIVGDPKVTLDKAGAKKFIKGQTDKNGNITGEIPGFQYVAGRKRLRVK